MHHASTTCFNSPTSWTLRGKKNKVKKVIKLAGFFSFCTTTDAVPKTRSLYFAPKGTSCFLACVGFLQIASGIAETEANQTLGNEFTTTRKRVLCWAVLLFQFILQARIRCAPKS